MATREILWNISKVGEVALYLLAAVSLAICAWGIYRHVRRILEGKTVQFSSAGMASRIGRALSTVLSNRTVLKRHKLGGAMHLLVMWGFIILFIGTCIVGVEYDLFHKLLGMEHFILQGPFYLGFEFVTDLFGIALVVGITLALIRRYILRRPQLQRQSVDWKLPVLILAIALTGFVVEGLRLAADAADLGYAPGWSPGGALLAAGITGVRQQGMQTAHVFFWWVHVVLALAAIALLPFVPKAMHLVAAGVNIVFEDLRPQGRLQKLDVEGAFERDEVLGYENLSDMTRKDYLDVISCTECGRCELNCPAANSGKSLSPRDVILGLRRQFNMEWPVVGEAAEQRTILEAEVSAEAIQVCTTCMACVEVCPAKIDPLSKILEIRRNEVMIHDRFPETYSDVFAGMERRGNPWSEHPTARLEWAKDLDVPIMADVAESGRGVEYLFWVGCSAAFDPRNSKIARSMVKILQEAGIDFAVLGEEERCTGDPARRMGHEYLFAMQAEANVELLEEYEFKHILTICPHCFNTFSKEYGDYGGDYSVVHHSQLIDTLITEGRLKLQNSVDAVVTFHDSCYLGRHNRIFDAPRNILAKIPGVQMVEMERSREIAMCCGAGGGLTWFEEETDQRVNDRRVEQAAAATQGVGGGKSCLIATSCPFCMTMIEDGLAARETGLEDRDIAELVVEAMKESGNF